MAWYIRYGMGGGFGDAGDWEEIQSENEEQANRVAYEAACENFSSYVGIHGVMSAADFMEDDPSLSEEEAQEMENEECESWIHYEAKWFDNNPNEEE
jgi:hypothetical protein